MNNVIDPREEYVEIIEKWQQKWMNVTGTDERDRQNYFHRAFGVDANMRYSLAKMLVEHERALLAREREITAALEKFAMEIDEDNYHDCPSGIGGYCSCASSCARSALDQARKIRGGA